MSWNLNLSFKPDFSEAMKRIDAWYANEMMDRAPVQFTGPNMCLPRCDNDRRPWKDRWFDADAILDSFERTIENMSFQAETFPLFWPNLGPVVYSAFHGTEMVFGEDTVWAEHLPDYRSVQMLTFDAENIYFRQIEKMMAAALERCKDRYMVGYTDLHPGMDCVSAWRNNEQLCMDLYDNTEAVKSASALSVRHWQTIFDHFDDVLKKHNQLSATWMGIPSFGKLHIPSCDFSAMISTTQFCEFVLPCLLEEMKIMTHNIFHLDGPGVAKHLDVLLELPQINAIQWVQGAGSTEPIMQWIPLLKRIQNAGKSMVVMLKKEELGDFMDEMSPNGVLVNIPSADHAEQSEIIRLVGKWK